MEIAILIIEMLIAIVWIQQGVVRYDFWEEGKPSGGFVPIIFGVVVLGVAIAILIREISGKTKMKSDYRFQLSHYIPALSAIVGAFLLQLVGIAAAVFFFIAIWMRYLSKYTWVKTLVTSLIFTAFIYGVFRMWLQVPFPKGDLLKLF